MIQDNYWTWSGGYAQEFESPKGLLRIEAIGNSRFVVSIKTERINKQFTIPTGKHWRKQHEVLNRLTRQLFELLK